jgi:hypothetical protein
MAIVRITRETHIPYRKAGDIVELDETQAAILVRTGWAEYIQNMEAKQNGEH